MDTELNLSWVQNWIVFSWDDGAGKCTVVWKRVKRYVDLGEYMVK